MKLNQMETLKKLLMIFVVLFANNWLMIHAAAHNAQFICADLVKIDR